MNFDDKWKLLQTSGQKQKLRKVQYERIYNWTGSKFWPCKLELWSWWIRIFGTKFCPKWFQFGTYHIQSEKIEGIRSEFLIHWPDWVTDSLSQSTGIVARETISLLWQQFYVVCATVFKARAQCWTWRVDRVESVILCRISCWDQSPYWLRYYPLV